MPAGVLRKPCFDSEAGIFSCACSDTFFYARMFGISIYIGYLCIVNRYNERRNNSNVMNQANNALTEAVYYILLALVEPLHGYGIMRRTAALSGGRLVISAGTLYGALSSLLDKGWIEPEAATVESRKKAYRLTDEGRAVLDAELERLRELVRNGERILNNR